MGTYFVLSGRGLSDIAYFAFWIVSKALELPIYEQSIHCQVDKIKNSRCLGLSCYYFIFTMWACQVRIFPC